MMVFVAQATVYLLAFFALTWLGNQVCRLVLSLSGLLPTNSAPGTDPATLSDAPVSASRAGRWIGPLERLLIAIGLMANSWEVLVAVVALKTVARYQELDKRTEAEYFLVGSLASLLWAIIVTLLMIYFDHEFGFSVFEGFFALHEDAATPGN